MWALYIPFIVLAIAALVATFSPKREGFQDDWTRPKPGPYSAPRAGYPTSSAPPFTASQVAGSNVITITPNAAQPAIQQTPLSVEAKAEIEANAKQACIDLGRRLGEANRVSNSLIDIKKQINNGAISLENARLQLERIVQLQGLQNIQGLQTLLATQLAPTTDIANISTAETAATATVRELNNKINQEFEKVQEFFRIVQTLFKALRCDYLI